MPKIINFNRISVNLALQIVHDTLLWSNLKLAFSYNYSKILKYIFTLQCVITKTGLVLLCSKGCIQDTIRTVVEVLRHALNSLSQLLATCAEIYARMLTVQLPLKTDHGIQWPILIMAAVISFNAS